MAGGASNEQGGITDRRRPAGGMKKTPAGRLPKRQQGLCTKKKKKHTHAVTRCNVPSQISLGVLLESWLRVRPNAGDRLLLLF